MCSEIETLDITEAEERAGLRRVYDLVDELPIPPDKTRKLAGYIARIEAERDKALARHGLFMVEGGPVVMATEYDALKAERDQFNAGWKSCIEDLRKSAEICRGVEAERDAAKQERDEALAAAEAMSRPVSDPEWERLIANSNADEDNEIWETIYRSDVNALIAARVRDSKEADNGKNGR
jgi:hypothetical protein